MTQFNCINDVLFWCQNIIPTVVDDSLSYLEAVYRMKQVLNETIQAVNELAKSNKDLTEEYLKTKLALEELSKKFDDWQKGYTIADGSITINMFAEDTLEEIQNLVANTVKDVAKFVTFGLTDDGYFCAYIPEQWTDIEFDTSEKGELILRL